MIRLRPMLALFKHWHPRLDRWVHPGERLPGLWLATMDGRTCGADCWIAAMELVLDKAVEGAKGASDGEH